MADRTDNFDFYHGNREDRQAYRNYKEGYDEKLPSIEAHYSLFSDL
jgi:hypothetical protein